MQPILDVIIAELRRQFDISEPYKPDTPDIQFFDASNPAEARIEGRVDLVALAVALARTIEEHGPRDGDGVDSRDT